MKCNYNFTALRATDGLLHAANAVLPVKQNTERRRLFPALNVVFLVGAESFKSSDG